MLHDGEMSGGEFSERDELTIFTGPEQLRDQYRKLHGRMTDVVGFELPITEAAIESLIGSEDGQWTGRQELADDSVPGAVRSAVLESLPNDVEPRYFEAESGRGASGYAVALELLGYVADVGGAGTVLWTMAMVVRRLYRNLQDVMGRRPLVSMGTAVYLAAADLSELIGVYDFQLHGSGDTRSSIHDAAYTGDDHFFVIFERNRVLYSYIVDARGRVHFQGELKMRDMLDELP